MPSRKVTVQLIGDSDSLERAFARSQRSGERFGKSMGLSAIPLKQYAKAGAVGAAIGGTALLTKQLGSSIAAAKEAQVAQAKLRQALTSAGKSYRLHGKQVDFVIQRTSKLAGIDDELVSDSFANLVRTSGDVSKAMKGIGLAADIARARNISLDSATKIVERTMNGQYLSLRRVGVQVDSNMTATEALEAAQRKFAGSAAAYGKTAAGAQDRLAVAFENLQEKVGQKLIPVLTKLAIKLTQLIEWTEKNWPKFQKAIEDMWAAVRPIFEAFRSYLDGWVKIIQGIIEGDWALAWKGVKTVVVSAFELLYEYLKLVPLRLFKFGLRMGKALADGIIEGIGNLTDRITDKIPGLNALFGEGSFEKRVEDAKNKLRAKGAATTSNRLRNYPGRAGGGLVSAGQSYVVGERGPELLTMGRRGGFVTPNAGSIYIGTVHVHGVQDVPKLIAEIERVAKRGVAQTRGSQAGMNLGFG